MRRPSPGLTRRAGLDGQHLDAHLGLVEGGAAAEVRAAIRKPLAAAEQVDQALAALGLPVEYIPILLTVDWFLDRCRIAIDMMGDMNVSCLLDGRHRGAAPNIGSSPADALAVEVPDASAETSPG